MKEVFEAHPKAKKIWMVKDMPFLNEREAVNYALSVNAEVNEVERPVEAPEDEFEKLEGSVAPESGETPPAEPPAPPVEPPAPPVEPPAPPATKPKGK